MSVVTTSWNRAGWLDRVWTALQEQTYKNIEWIVADDGSEDNTSAVVRELAARSRFPVTLVRASVRIGKARMDNEAIACARGELVMLNDSDDYLLPQAIEDMTHAWFSIEPARRKEFVGVTALCADQNGQMTAANADVRNESFDTTWNEMSQILQINGDMVYLMDRKTLAAHPFPEVDYVVPEGAVWSALGEMKTRFVPKILKINHYRSPHAISFSGKMAYNRGRAHAMVLTARHLARYRMDLRSMVWRAMTYVRYCLHGDVHPRQALALWRGNSGAWLLWVVSPLAFALACKDRLQGKVEKTHLGYLAACKHVVVTREFLPCGRIDCAGGP